MEKFIIIAGSPDSGKTTTVNLAIQKLIDKGYNVIGDFNDKSKDNFWLIKGRNGETNTGGSTILEKNGKKIALISYGDDEKTLKDLFSKIVFVDYYAIVCCSHATRGKNIFDFFHGLISKINLKTTEIVPLYKNLLCGHDNNAEENNHMANFIVKLLEQ